MAAAAPSVHVNGVQRSLAGTDPAAPLLEYLRGLGLTGAKEGCAEGECGACAVMVLREDGVGSRWTGVNACLVPAAAFDGQEVVTAEGLGTPDDLHPVQHELATRGGSQCGYCTPGFVCSMAAEYYRPDRRATAHPSGNGHRPSTGFDLEAIAGNLCRCTGYRPIRDAALSLGEPAADEPLAHRATRPAPPARPTRLEGAGRTFVRPADLDEALATLASDPDAVVIAGCTDWGVEVNLRTRRAPLAVAVERLPELREVAEHDGVLTVGAALSLTEVERALGGRVRLLDELLPQFASRLIRNSATIGGNLATASPIGDLAPGLLALEARVVLVSSDGEREVDVADFFTGYRQSTLRPGELIRAVRVPVPLSPFAAFHKVAKRRLDDISSVAVAVALDLTDGVVTRARIGLGGVAATPLRARDTEAALEGRPWSREAVEVAAEVLAREGTPMDDLRASAGYRRAMLGSSLRALHASSPQGVLL